MVRRRGGRNKRAHAEENAKAGGRIDKRRKWCRNDDDNETVNFCFNLFLNYFPTNESAGG